MTVEHRPTRTGLARLIFGSGPIGKIRPFEYRPMKGDRASIAEQVVVGDAIAPGESFNRAETVVITNV